jgi:transposase-like protein
MSYPKKVKDLARELRFAGKSISEICAETGIARSTCSLWMQEIPVTKEIARKMREHELRGRTKGLAAIAARRDIALKKLDDEALEIWSHLSIKNSKQFWQVCASLLFWCEGSKQLNNMMFSNSDPKMIQIYLKALRYGFDIDEAKLRIHLHLHEYHVVDEQIRYWSQITGIPQAQFNKPYIKPHTGKRKREGYPGCVSLRYGEARLARRMTAIYYAFATNNIGV